jgi:alpha-galactosidase
MEQLVRAFRQNPHQVFGRYPNGIAKGLDIIGPFWRVDGDAKQFADWGIDYVKYDWKEWTLEKKGDIYKVDQSKPVIKTEALTKRVFDNLRAQDCDIIVSLSPNHSREEDQFVTKYQKRDNRVLSG